jgi:hypothetical protein
MDEIELQSIQTATVDYDPITAIDKTNDQSINQSMITMEKNIEYSETHDLSHPNKEALCIGTNMRLIIKQKRFVHNIVVHLADVSGVERWLSKRKKNTKKQTDS